MNRLPSARVHFIAANLGTVKLLQDALTGTGVKNFLEGDPNGQNTYAVTAEGLQSNLARAVHTFLGYQQPLDLLFQTTQVDSFFPSRLSQIETSAGAAVALSHHIQHFNFLGPCRIVTLRGETTKVYHAFCLCMETFFEASVDPLPLQQQPAGSQQPSSSSNTLSTHPDGIPLGGHQQYFVGSGLPPQSVAASSRPPHFQPPHAHPHLFPHYPQEQPPTTHGFGQDAFRHLGAPSHFQAGPLLPGHGGASSHMRRPEPPQVLRAPPNAPAPTRPLVWQVQSGPSSSYHADTSAALSSQASQGPPTSSARRPGAVSNQMHTQQLRRSRGSSAPEGGEPSQQPCSSHARVPVSNVDSQVRRFPIVELPNASRLQEPGEKGKERPTHKVMLEIPAYKVPRLVGSNGSCIREFHNRTGAFFDYARYADSEGMKALTITGTRLQVENAAKLVENKLAFWAVNGAESSSKMRLRVVEDRVGRLIGSRGKCVAEMQLLSGAVIDFDKVKLSEDEIRRTPLIPPGDGGEGSDVQYRGITLTGTEAGVEAAYHIILEKLRPCAREAPATWTQQMGAGESHRARTAGEYTRENAEAAGETGGGGAAAVIRQPPQQGPPQYAPPSFVPSSMRPPPFYAETGEGDEEAHREHSGTGFPPSSLTHSRLSLSLPRGQMPPQEHVQAPPFLPYDSHSSLSQSAKHPASAAVASSSAATAGGGGDNLGSRPLSVYPQTHTSQPPPYSLAPPPYSAVASATATPAVGAPDYVPPSVSSASASASGLGVPVLPPQWGVTQLSGPFSGGTRGVSGAAGTGGGGQRERAPGPAQASAASDPPPGVPERSPDPFLQG